jgi:hypothetical protein
MKLSAAEKKKIAVGGTGGSVESLKFQAMGKLMSEKLAHPDAIERALGRVWCPIKGIECQAMGENKFLITFLQASGKRKALEERPWVFSNELLVLSELDDSKAIDEIEFNMIPIWIRIQKLPIGLMNKEVGELLGNEVGECLEVDVGDGDVKIGSFLRVKIRLDIRKPLMRGVTVQVGAAGVEKWCPIIYEYLPDFCYICGFIGHTDRACTIQLKKGEKRQFGGEMRWLPPRFAADQDGKGRWESRRSLSNRSNSSGDGRSGKWGNQMSRSDVDSWKKKGVEEGEEVTSPEKSSSEGVSFGASVARKNLLFGQGFKGDGGEEENRSKESQQALVQKEVGEEADVNSAMQHEQQVQKEAGKQGVVEERVGSGKVRRFKRVIRTNGSSEEKTAGGLVMGKRNLVDTDMMDVEVGGEAKKCKGDQDLQTEEEISEIEAGLSEQPCRKQ